MAKRDNWDKYIMLLKLYKEQNGNCDVPFDYNVLGVNLGIWFNNVKQRYRKGTLSEERVKELEDLGVNWKLRLTWDESFELLKKFKEEFGHTNVPVNYEVNGFKLGVWFRNQKEAVKSLDLPLEKKVKFEELGIYIHLYKSWDETYNELKKIYEDDGDIELSPENRLYKWIIEQRYKKNKGNLSDRKAALLEDLDMVWDQNKKRLDDFHKLLDKYYEEHGNIDLNATTIFEGKKLGQWLFSKKRAYNGDLRRGISNLEIVHFNSLNIDWKLTDTKTLNAKINIDNKNKYYRILNERVNHILSDLTLENINEITKDNQKEIEKIIVKRIFR